MLTAVNGLNFETLEGDPGDSTRNQAFGLKEDEEEKDIEVVEVVDRVEIEVPEGKKRPVDG